MSKKLRLPALHRAAIAPDHDAIRDAVGQGADINASDTYVHMAVMQARKQQRLAETGLKQELADLLRTFGARM